MAIITRSCSGFNLESLSKYGKTVKAAISDEHSAN